MKFTGLSRRLAAVGAGVAVVGTLVTGAVAAPAVAGTAPPKVSVTTPKASPKKYEGACPVTVTFSAKVKVAVNGKTTVAYRWLRGDGSKSKTKTRTLTGKGVKTITVTEKATFTKDAKGWRALRVLSPRKVTTKKSRFAVSCEGPVVVVVEKPKPQPKVVKRPKYAKAFVYVRDYVGECTSSTKITARGLIKVGRPMWVGYRWVHNGKVVDHGKVKVVRDKRVSYTFTPKRTHKGRVTLDIVSPRYGGADRDAYAVVCKKAGPPPEPPIEATASVTAPDDYAGYCPPISRTFIGTVTVSRIGTGGTAVRYRWAGMNGSQAFQGPIETLAFAEGEPLSKEVSHTVGVGESSLVQRWIEILSPNSFQSNTDEVTVQCTPVTARITSMSAVPDYSTCDVAAGIGPTITFGATVGVSGPTTLIYRWEIGDDPIVVPGERVVSAAERTVTVQHKMAGSTQTLGRLSVALTILSPSSSNWRADFSFPCPTV